MKPDLSSVTLIVADTRCHALAKIALDEITEACNFGAVVLFSNDFSVLWHHYAQQVLIEDWPSKLEWERFIWENAWRHVATSHALFMEWDAGIFDAKMWTPEFLRYDYIGAPWWYQDGRNVGNGGFSMRSRDLMRKLSALRSIYPVKEPGDETLSRVYRPELERKHQMQWAPEDMAHQFSFECTRPFPTSRHFGYHAMRNWPHVMDRDKLIERTRLAEANKYIAGTGMLAQLYHVAPWLKEAAAA